MPSTGLVRKLAFAPEYTAPPTQPAEGGRIDWDNEPNWDTVGTRDEGDIAELDVDSVSATPLEEVVTDNPPRAQMKKGEIVIKNGVESVSFALYDLSAAAHALVSTAFKRSHTQVSQDRTIAYKAMVVEIDGKGFDYYPRVRVKMTGRAAAVSGDGGLHKMQYEAVVFGTDEYPAGYDFFGAL